MSRVRKLVPACAVGAAIFLVGAPASAMPVSTFLTKFNSLEQKGALATATSDAGLLKNELSNSAAQLKAERLAATQKGLKPAYCPDAQATPPSFDDIMGALKAVPASAQARTEVKGALRAYMSKRFPCTK